MGTTFLVKEEIVNGTILESGTIVTVLTEAQTIDVPPKQFLSPDFFKFMYKVVFPQTGKITNFNSKMAVDYINQKLLTEDEANSFLSMQKSFISYYYGNFVKDITKSGFNSVAGNLRLRMLADYIILHEVAIDKSVFGFNIFAKIIKGFFKNIKVGTMPKKGIVELSSGSTYFYDARVVKTILDKYTKKSYEYKQGDWSEADISSNAYNIMLRADKKNKDGVMLATGKFYIPSSLGKTLISYVFYKGNTIFAVGYTNTEKKFKKQNKEPATSKLGKSV